jgi:hypothetical protein
MGQMIAPNAPTDRSAAGAGQRSLSSTWASNCADDSLGKPRSLPTPPGSPRGLGNPTRDVGNCVDDSLGKPRSLLMIRSASLAHC